MTPDEDIGVRLQVPVLLGDGRAVEDYHDYIWKSTSGSD